MGDCIGPPRVNPGSKIENRKSKAKQKYLLWTVVGTQDSNVVHNLEKKFTEKKQYLVRNICSKIYR